MLRLSGYQARRCGRFPIAVGLLSLMLALHGASFDACAQESSSEGGTTQSLETPAEPSQQPSEQRSTTMPGFFDTLGGWIRNSADGVSSNLRDTQDRLGEINKGVIDTLPRLPATGMASGRVTCQPAMNGAPDCYAAAAKLCQDKGYVTGKSLFTESAETCKPRVLIPGYKRRDGDCRVDTVVTRASCS